MLVFWDNPFLFGCTACSVLVPHPTVTEAVEAPQLLLVSGKGQHQKNTQANKPVGDPLFWSVLECLEKKLRKISSVVYGCGGAGPQPKEADRLPRSQGRVVQRLPQDKLMEDLIPDQFKGSGSL